MQVFTHSQGWGTRASCHSVVCLLAEITSHGRELCSHYLLVLWLITIRWNCCFLSTSLCTTYLNKASLLNLMSQSILSQSPKQYWFCYIHVRYERQFGEWPVSPWISLQMRIRKHWEKTLLFMIREVIRANLWINFKVSHKKDRVNKSFWVLEILNWII